MRHVGCAILTPCIHEICYDSKRQCQHGYDGSSIEHSPKTPTARSGRILRTRTDPVVACLTATWLAFFADVLLVLRCDWSRVRWRRLILGHGVTFAYWQRGFLAIGQSQRDTSQSVGR